MFPERYSQSSDNYHFPIFAGNACIFGEDAGAVSGKNQHQCTRCRQFSPHGLFVAADCPSFADDPENSGQRNT
jgi:hypothetical protein